MPTHHYLMHYTKHNMPFPEWHTQTTLLATLLFLFFFNICPQVINADDLTEEDRCLLKLFSSGSDTMTFAEARTLCSQEKTQVTKTDGETVNEPMGLVEKRLQSDEKNILKPFSLMSHEPNYLLAGAYNFQGWSSSIYENTSSNFLEAIS